MLVVGSGGREHALGWRLSQSPGVEEVFTAPGNGGAPGSVGIGFSDLNALADFADENGCFTVVGPEAALADGIVDYFEDRGLGIIGPSKKASWLESSKIYAKEFMARNGIPTAEFASFDEPRKALVYAGSLSYDVVVKADGLAEGKGVVVCHSKQDAESAIDAMLVDGKFGDAGRKIIVERRLDGIEASYIALCDGDSAIPMAASRDHKRAHDGDKGPNTGGMGAYSPVPEMDGPMSKRIQDEIINKTVSCMKSEGTPFRGFLYAGIMIDKGRPFVLEYNVRMGDPECQPLMMRADFDLYEYLSAATGGGLSGLPAPKWSSQHAACIVMASGGYPVRYDIGEEITGLGDVPEDVMVFHAGTQQDGEKVLTSGGRVLGVTALGDTLSGAVSRAYDSVSKISWPGAQYRTDIGVRP
ncbi:phosphoribosylamine-glycine ligase [Cenarchaeum symbiosum A]|uniref:Phosphoribosylamine--glycine ligase n=1 Tax=Cenarchaeum symbiosum (strain A) TaxID=414004 RepID=A0RTU1_CENSY|nr:phosphoribosylamine-glycine ligase [Cenarchaeum symbiosum A]